MRHSRWTSDESRLWCWSVDVLKGTCNIIGGNLALGAEVLLQLSCLLDVSLILFSHRWCVSTFLLKAVPLPQVVFVVDMVVVVVAPEVIVDVVGVVVEIMVVQVAGKTSFFVSTATPENSVPGV